MCTHFRDIAWSISLIQISYDTIYTIYCVIGGLNKGRRSRQIAKMGAQNSTSILKIVVNHMHRYYSCKIALRITPIGKLFHIISNISYLSLLRFKIVFVYSKYVVSLHLPGRIKILLCTSAKFPQLSKFFRTNVFHFSGICASCWSLCCCWWWGGGWVNTILISTVEEFLLL